MDSVTLQLAVKYATKSGKLTLAQKIIDELIEQKKDQEERQKNNQCCQSESLPLYSYSSSIISHSSTFEEIKQTWPKMSASNASFTNPFRKKALTNSINETSTTDELSKWKPSVNKARRSSSNRSTIQVQSLF